MAKRQLQTVLHHVHLLAATRQTSALSDVQLLRQYVSDRDEAAFTALMHRHAAMVLGVCRRVLHQSHDAEDACQAAFLILARKATSIWKPKSVASWLHGVAFRIARKLRADLNRRSARTTSLFDEHAAGADGDFTWREIKIVLDEELQRLPATYGAPLVLCYLEGKTQDEAARQLGWTLPTLRGRLERARQRLRARLTRRGITLSAALLGGALTQSAGFAAVPARLVVATAKAGLTVATGKSFETAALSPQVAALIQGALRAMLLTKLKITTIVLAALGILGSAAHVLTYHAGATAAQGAWTTNGSDGGKCQDFDERPDKPKALDQKNAKEAQGGQDKPVSELDQLKAEIKKTANAIATIENQQKMLQIDLELLKARLEQLQRAMESPKGKELPGVKPPPPPLQGTITQVDDKAKLVKINVGSDHGLHKGNTLDVYRLQPKAQYLGRVLIIDVQSASAVGRIEAMSNTAIKAGDQVGSLGEQAK
jgi:RNA polymerase sigma factor (sigma-70 family)